MAMRERAVLATQKSRTQSGKVRAAATWALRKTRRPWLADWWGVSKTRASHKTTNGDNELARVAAFIADPTTDGAAALTVLLEAFEHRFLNQPVAELRARLAFLMGREHDREAAQNRGLQDGRKANDAIRDHIADLLEIVTHRTALGLEDA